MTKIEFPDVSDVDVSFGGYPKDFFNKALQKESPEKYQNMAQSLFFSGGKLNLNDDLPDEYVTKGIRILKAIIGSFTPKHEHKIHVCGVILNAICKE
jgi:hypothetical protein